MLATLTLHDRPGDIVQNDNVRTPALEGFGRNDKNASADFGYRSFPQPLQPAHVAIAQPRVHREQHHGREMFRQPLKEVVLFRPCNGIRAPTRFRQHGDRRRHCLKPRTAIIVAVGARGAIENGAHNLEAAIDRGGRGARREPCLNERFERRVMDPVRREMTDMRLSASEHAR